MTRFIGLITKNKEKFNNFKDQNFSGVLSGKLSKHLIGDNYIIHTRCNNNILTKFSKFEDNFVLLDGNIYNYDILKKRFKSNFEDLDMLLDLFNKHSFNKIIEHMEGDFSIIYYNKKNKQFFFGRDLFGVKPFYYSFFKTHFVFSSQPFPILKTHLVSKKINKHYAARFSGLHYRLFDNIPDSSPYEGISQLPAKSFISYFTNENKFLIKRYWSFSDVKIESETLSEINLVQNYKELIINSVRKRNISNRKKIFTLSGGLDSSSVISSSCFAYNKKFDAVSILYKDREYDERDEIMDVVKTKTKKWEKLEIGNTIDLEKYVEKIVLINNEPVATATWLSHYLLSEHLSKKGYEIVYGGLGGDEFNAGEYEYFPMFFADHKISNSRTLNTEIELWTKYHNHSLYKKDKFIAEQLINSLTDLSKPGNCKPDIMRLNKYKKAIDKDFYNFEGMHINMHSPSKSYLTNRTYQDLFFETLPCCLRAQDRHGSFFGFETINPFLDKNIAEFMFSIPFNFKIRDGITKYLLRKAMRGILPESTRNRIKKTGWNAPAHLWFSGKNMDFLKDEINSSYFKSLGIYNNHIVFEIINEHEKIINNNLKKENHMMFLWQLVNIIQWYKILNKYI